MMNLRIFLIPYLCFACGIAFADLGALSNYRGDWMIDQNRQHLVSTRWTTEGDTLELRYSYRSPNCPRWTHVRWVMHHNAKNGSYHATIYGRGTSGTANGHWDDSTKTLTWKVTRITESTLINGSHLKRTEKHSFDDRELLWGVEHFRRDGQTYTNQTMVFDLLAR